jgi:hypothetical protein
MADNHVALGDLSECIISGNMNLQIHENTNYKEEALF